MSTHKQNKKFDNQHAVTACWFVVQNQHVAGELITIQIGLAKYVLVFTELNIAHAFLDRLEDENLKLVILETWILKESFLRAAKMISAQQVMFNYFHGVHNAHSAILEDLITSMHAKIGTTFKPQT